jgi:HlyD family secretion protein
MRVQKSVILARAVGLLACALVAVTPWTQEAPADSATPEVGARQPATAFMVSALGRIEPKDGPIRIAGPSETVVVVEELRVDVGARVESGQVLAVLDSAALYEADVARARARLANARAGLKRNLELHRGEVVSDSKRDSWQLEVDIAHADLRKTQAALERATVRSPIDGQVLEVHAREGERVGEEGIVELGQTHAMYAIAEVYETDIGRVRLGQEAAVHSPALPRVLRGSVERIRPKVGKLDALGTDPAARTDARVVEVEIRLAEADSEAAAPLTNLQVSVEIEP